MDSKVATFSAVGATQYDVAIGPVEHLVRGHEDARERVVEAPGHESGDQSLSSWSMSLNRAQPGSFEGGKGFTLDMIDTD